MNRWIPIVLFLVSLAQLAPTNFCLCSVLPCVNNSKHQDELICIEEGSCPCHDGKDTFPCRSEENQSSHSCPFEQTCGVSDYAGTKKIVSCEIGRELQIHDFNPIPQILSAQKESCLILNHSLPPVPLYLRLQSILI